MSTQGRSYSWNAICKVCGFQYKGQDMRRRWDGLEPVCQTCWEPRHPMDFFRTRNDFHKLPWQSPVEDITPDTGFGYTYDPSSTDYSYTSTTGADSTYYSLFYTVANCRPVAFRYWHDGLYSQENGPITFTLWTKSSLGGSYTQVAGPTLLALPNAAGWIQAPISQAGSGILFTYSDDVGVGYTIIAVGVRYGKGASVNIPITLVAGDAPAAQTYLDFQDTAFSTEHSPNSTLTSAGGYIPIDLIVRPESDYDAITYS